MTGTIRFRDLLILALVFSLLAGVSVGVGLLLERRHAEQLWQATEITAEQVAQRLEEHVATRLSALRHLADQWRQNPPQSQEVFAEQALSLQQLFPGFQAINWVDAQGVIRWVVPRETNEAAVGVNLRTHPPAAEAFLAAERTGQLQATPSLELLQGGVGFAVYLPVEREGVLQGYVNGAFRVRHLVESCLQGDATLARFDLTLSDGSREIYRHGSISAGAPCAATYPIRIVDRQWRVTLAPNDFLGVHPDVALGGGAVAGLGLLLSGALLWLLHLLLRQQATLREGLERARLSEERYRLLVENVNDGIVISQDDHFVFFNRRFAEMLGHTPEELERLTYREVYTARGLEILAERRALRERGGDVPARYETTFRRRDGTEIDVEANVAVFEYRGRLATFAVIRDIRERRQADRALRESEARYRRAIALADAVAYEQELPSHEFTHWGEGIERLTGFRPEELTAEVWRGLVQEEVLRGLAATLPREEVTRRLATGELLEWQADYRIRTRTGETRWLSDSSVHILDAAGRPARALGILQDITERKRAEEAVREALGRFEAVIEGTPAVAVQGFDREGRILHWNSASERLYGFSAAQALGQRIDELLGLGAAGEDLRRMIREIWDTGEAAAPHEWLTRTHEGEERWVYSTMFPVRQRGKVVEVFCMDVDITPRRRAEAALRERNEVLAIQNAVAQAAMSSHSSAELCDRLLEVIRGAMACDAFVVDLVKMPDCTLHSLRCYDTVDGVVRAVPPAESATEFRREGRFCRQVVDGRRPLLLLRTPEEMHSTELIPIGDTARRSASLLWAPLVVGDRVIGVISVQSYTPNAYGQREVDLLMAVAQQTGPALEVTLLAEELRESEQRLRTLFEGIDDALLVHDSEGRILDCNDAACRWLGHTREALLAMRTADIEAPEFAALFAERLERQGAQRRHTCEGEYVAKDGRRIPVELSTTRIDYRGRPAVLAVARDLTERRRVEEERARIQAQMLRTQKLESLGVLAGGIAHDFNNLLTGILGNAQLALMDLPPGVPSARALSEITRAAERAALLTRQMLAYSGKGTFAIRAVDLSAQVRELSTLLTSSIANKKVMLRLELADNLPAVEVDTAQLQQLIMNLVINGAEAIGEGEGTVIVSTGLQEIASSQLPDFLAADNFAPGPHVFLEVHDTGCGMDEETKARIFEPFFTTKFTGRGLGLAAVLGIVRGHRGALRVYSTPGRGSTFKVLFPVSNKSSEAEVSPDPADLAGNGLILVVDDEAPVRDLAKTALERFGYRVLTAENGRAGIEIFRARGAEIDLVLLDMTMPVMSGEETFRALRALRPELPVLLTSGYNEIEATRRFVTRGLAGFIQKPFRPRDLAAKVKEVLAGVQPRAGAAPGAAVPPLTPPPHPTPSAPDGGTGDQ